MIAVRQVKRRLPGVSCVRCTVLVAALVGAWIQSVPAAAAAAATTTTTLETTYQGSLARTGFTRDRSIGTSNVAQLHVSWQKSAGAVISVQPAAVNGVEYWGDWNGYEHATTSSGQELWRTFLGTTTPPPHAGCVPPSAGVASSATVGTINSEQVVWTGTGDGGVAALEASNGQILWKTQIAPSKSGFVWSSPALHAGWIYVGLSSYGDCPLVAGRLVKLNAVSGAIRTSLRLPPQGCSGDGVWSSPAVDSSGDVYVTTGNGTCTDPHADAILKISARTMAVEDSWQVPAGQQTTDSDWGATPTLFSANLNNVTTQLIGGVDKNGVFYALKTASLSSGPLWQVQVADPGNCPQCGGGAIAPAAFNNRMLFVAGGSVSINGNACAGSVDALDPATGNWLWRHCLNGGAVLGGLTATPGLVFATDGANLIALSAGWGKQLFSYTEPSNSVFYAACTLLQGTLYVGNTDGNLLAFTTT